MLNPLSPPAMAGVTAIRLAATAPAADMPTDPLGGKPPVGSKVSVQGVDCQLRYQRAFEAVLWPMPGRMSAMNG